MTSCQVTWGLFHEPLSNKIKTSNLGGGFKYLLYSSLLAEMIQFDEHIFQMGGSTTNWKLPQIASGTSWPFSYKSLEWMIHLFLGGSMVTYVADYIILPFPHEDFRNMEAVLFRDRAEPHENRKSFFQKIRVSFRCSIHLRSRLYFDESFKLIIFDMVQQFFST